MGYSKLVKVSDHKIRLIHQLGQDGKPYAEDITIELDETVDPSRLAHLAAQDGKVGVAYFSFSAVDVAGGDVAFPEEQKR